MELSSATGNVGFRGESYVAVVMDGMIILYADIMRFMVRGSLN